MQSSAADGQVGIDLGLKDTATCSNGLKLESKPFYREAESQLAVAQRAHKKQRVKAIHTKVKNRCLDHIHKFTIQVVREHSLIVVSNVRSNVKSYHFGKYFSGTLSDCWMKKSSKGWV